MYLVSVDFGLLKFRYFVVLLREEDFWAGGKVRRDDGFVSRR